MRTFYSPAERRLLASLPEEEARMVELIMQTFDAHLLEDGTDVEVQPTLFEAVA